MVASLRHRITIVGATREAVYQRAAPVIFPLVDFKCVSNAHYGRFIRVDGLMLTGRRIWATRPHFMRCGDY